MREVSQALIFVLRTCLSFDEIMTSFFSRSSETHWMKNKLIKEDTSFLFLPPLLDSLLTLLQMAEEQLMLANKSTKKIGG